ncbi:hypothetical protein Vadar_009221 [Vaccinium darrowii]|uniref:Uncharacterized protein n=1 Tax=Vaccinium darrowii TaxID=229202 RepID=A0ACB7XGF0_9ERIC|nr:hypothetical protein Vadar_009221 [Vaccinium darrowii]
MDDRFQRSGGTISKHIKKITPALEDFAAKWVAPLQCHEHWRPYLERSKKYCHFKDCIGAVDGTHIPCNPPREKAANYWSHKGMHTFNVLAVADFNLCFTFAVTGYEGAMHDYQIFKEETIKTNNRYPHPPPGKYYLVDAGYPNAKGYLAPYKGYMYHQDEFRRRSVPVTDSNEQWGYTITFGGITHPMNISGMLICQMRITYLEIPQPMKFANMKWGKDHISRRRIGRWIGSVMNFEIPLHQIIDDRTNVVVHVDDNGDNRVHSYVVKYWPLFRFHSEEVHEL